MAKTTVKKAGPVSCAARPLIRGPKHSTAVPAVCVELRWTSKEIGIYLGKRKNTLGEFLNRTADFTAFTIGTEWRPDPEAGGNMCDHVATEKHTHLLLLRFSNIVDSVMVKNRTTLDPWLGRDRDPFPQPIRLAEGKSACVAWRAADVEVSNRIIFLDASSIDLGAMGGEDSHRASGFRQDVDNHYKRLVGLTVLSNLLTAGFQLSQSRSGTILQDPNPEEIAAGSVGPDVSQTGAQITRRNLNIQPTIKVQSATDLTFESTGISFLIRRLRLLRRVFP